MTFHPFEIAFCGYSGSGKTTLLTKVVRSLAERYSVACYKHGCHHFSLDKEGKDSWLMRQAGASAVMIGDPQQQALMAERGVFSLALERHAFAFADMLLVEGLKELPLPKLLMIDAERRIVKLWQQGSISNVLGFISPDDPQHYTDYGLPVMQRDNVEAIAHFVESILLERAKAHYPLNGLLLAGGQSSRMGSDKALLSYHGDNQLQHTAALLREVCCNVYVSCRQEQAEHYCQFGIPLITDAYLGIGPMGGLLSAQQAHPNAAWLVTACDMPLLTPKTLQQLAEERQPLRFATAFRHPQTQRLEPLFAIYEPKTRIPLLLQHAEGNNSLASFLATARIAALMPDAAQSLLNINTPDEQKSFEQNQGRA
uniref:Probable molybdenum cofactor guanylyltransferase n=1 Tax=Chlorobium chlorochromatii (strain CaD3) TaxID=340177 RepID=Q3ARQ3_CHLCH